MTVVMLAAGTSSRMGKINKLLLPVNGTTLICSCCLEALKYLSAKKEKSKLIVVIGYRSQSSLKALKPCMDFIEKTSSSVQMIVVKNSGYRKGQFSSAKVGVKNVEDGEEFFISLADMPKVKAENYEALEKSLKGHDAVRPFVNKIPGHPVLLSSTMREKVLSKPNDFSVSRILSDCKIKELSFTDSSWIKDLDTVSDLT